MSFLTDPNGAPLSQQIDPNFLASLAFELFAKEVSILNDDEDIETAAKRSLDAAKIFVRTNASYKP